MRFMLDMMLTQPGTDLGESPSSPFEPEPRQIDIDAALAGIELEATSLLETFSELSPEEWHSIVTLDGGDVDPHWIVRHAVHQIIRLHIDRGDQPCGRFDRTYAECSRVQSSLLETGTSSRTEPAGGIGWSTVVVFAGGQVR